MQHLGPTTYVGSHSLGDVAYKLSLLKHDTLSIDHLVNPMPHVDVISPFIWFFDAGKYMNCIRLSIKFISMSCQGTWISSIQGSPSNSKHLLQTSSISLRWEQFIAILGSQSKLYLILFSLKQHLSEWFKAYISWLLGLDFHWLCTRMFALLTMTCNSNHPVPPNEPLMSSPLSNDVHPNPLELNVPPILKLHPAQPTIDNTVHGSSFPWKYMTQG